jgi:hypothetical protein
VSDAPKTLRELTEGWLLGETWVFVLDADDLPKSIDGLRPRRRYQIVFEDIEYVNETGKIVTTHRREAGLVTAS